MTAEELEDEILTRRWFYRLQLPSGRWTEAYIPDDVLEIHETRLRMLREFARGLLPRGAGTALDIACHEGYFALHLARDGFDAVLGVDVREENIRHASLLRDVFAADNRTHTRRALLVETQIAPGLSGQIDWGSYRWTKQMHGAFAVIDETDEIAINNHEANTVPISLVPSLDALCHVMRAVGFARVDILRPPEGAHEQLASGKRVVVAGYVE